MSIFFKFGVELGEPHNITCDGMDMSLGDLKLAIKDQRRIKNVTDFDLQVIKFISLLKGLAFNSSPKAKPKPKGFLHTNCIVKY